MLRTSTLACSYSILLGLYATASGLWHVLGHGDGLWHARCARVLCYDMEEGFAKRAVCLLSHGLRGLCAGLPEGKLCAQGLPAQGRAGQHEAVPRSSACAALRRVRFL